MPIRKRLGKSDEPAVLAQLRDLEEKSLIDEISLERVESFLSTLKALQRQWHEEDNAVAGDATRHKSSNNDYDNNNDIKNNTNTKKKQEEEEGGGGAGTMKKAMEMGERAKNIRLERAGSIGGDAQDKDEKHPNEEEEWRVEKIPIDVAECEEASADYRKRLETEISGRTMALEALGVLLEKAMEEDEEERKVRGIERDTRA